tara:strand:- start:1649 stop:2380 length:732 start_codon:yes stop_codon:yes gene_type:complete
MTIRNDNVHSIRNRREQEQMEKDAAKEAIKQITIEKGISVSELARSCNLAESTLTGFMNDVSNRAKHGLSAKTINAITQNFPQFKVAFSIPQSNRKSFSIKIVGQWMDNYNVIPLLPNMASSVNHTYFEGIENQCAVVESKVGNHRYATHFEQSRRSNSYVNDYGIYRTDHKHYIFNQEFADPLKDGNLLGKTCYGQTETGIFYIGILSVIKNKAKFLKLNGEPIKEAGNIVAVSKVLWVSFG